MDDSISSPPHILMFPLPSWGDLNPMLKLAELLCLSNLKVTFINTKFNHERLIKHADIEAHFSRYPSFKFELIHDGLDDNHPRAGDNWLQELLLGLKTNADPLLKEMLPGSTLQTSPVTCLIADALLRFALDVAKEAQTPVIEFRAVGASFLWMFLCIPKLIEAGEIPFKDSEDMDQLVQNVPGMSTFLRRRDLPSTFQIKDDNGTRNVILQNAAKEIQNREPNPIILNTFDDLEGLALSLLQTCYPTIYTVGPLHAHLKYTLGQEEAPQTKSHTGLWEEDRSCISWLDKKPKKSVLYVSFGSLAVITRDQLMEIWAGLVQSQKYFLWVVRSNMIMGNDPECRTPTELFEGTKERGCITHWAPQEEVLAHKAVGGFFTHSGWNSTLESITAGVPMLCWPNFFDQLLNSRFVGEVWKIGIDMKDKCDRNVVEKMVRDLMDRKRSDLENSMTKMSQFAKRSISEGGSSFCNLKRLIEDINQTTKRIAH